MNSSESSKEPMKTSEENVGSCKEDGESLKPENENSPQVFQCQNRAFQGWKLPVQSLKEPRKEPSSCRKTHPSEHISNTAEKNNNFQNEASENMPVILNVFSLSKDPVKQSNTKQENSVLFTPPCSPPYVQLGPFSALPVTSQKPRVRDEFINQAPIQQRRENWYKPVQAYHNFHEYS
jgi:hypothetical protein